MEYDKKKPLVSVIVPCYNHELFIKQCIESIINQSYKNFELVVIDDGSIDNSVKILTELQEIYCFNLVVQRNMGVALTLDKGIKQYSTGKYIAVCASDDYWVPDKLELQVNFLETHPDVLSCFGKTYVVDQKGNSLPKLTKAKNNKLKGGYIFEDIILLNFSPPVNYLIKKTIFEEIGFSKSIWAEDFYLNLKISEKYLIGYLDQYLSYYRITDSEKSKMINLKTIASHLESINEYKHLKIYKKAKKMWYLRCFYWYSKFASTKKIAFMGMIKNIDQIFHIYFIKSLIKLVLLWQ